MFTTSKIRRQIFHFQDNKPFSVRSYLHLGPRAAVYRTFSRLVKAGIIIRISYGLFIKADAPWPSIYEVAKTKADAFHKEIFTHGAVAAHALKLVDNSPNKSIFACSGATSNFKFGDIVIHLTGICARKRKLADSKAGLAIRALWHIGKKLCTFESIQLACAPFQASDNHMFKQSRNLMPAWLHYFFTLVEKNMDMEIRQRFKNMTMSPEEADRQWELSLKLKPLGSDYC
jgi:hypothetical protein